MGSWEPKQPHVAGLSGGKRVVVVGSGGSSFTRFSSRGRGKAGCADGREVIRDLSRSRFGGGGPREVDGATARSAQGRTGGQGSHSRQKQALRWEYAGFDELSCGVIVAQKVGKSTP